MLKPLATMFAAAQAAVFAVVPASLVGTLIMLTAGIIAAVFCRMVVRQLRRFITRFGIYPSLILDRCQGPTGAFLVLFTLGIALQISPFTDPQAADFNHVMLAVFVVLIGWSAINTLDLFTDLYVQRLRLDVEDNLVARKHQTQVGILRGALRTLIVLITIGAALMTSHTVRQYGISLFASAGAAALVVGLAARPVLSNLLAGIQIAITQPIRLEDAVIVEDEWGWIEKISSTYVVVRIWDLRRMILPLSYFIETPFQNWTYQSADLMGSVMLLVDYSVPVDKVRDQLNAIVKDHPKWDGKVAGVQMTDLPDNMVQLRLLVSARNSGQLFDLRCDVREAIVSWLIREYPEALPRQRNELLGQKVEVQTETMRKQAVLF